MRVIGWNLLSVVSAFRQAEISLLFNQYSVSLLAGTESKAAVNKYQLDEHTAYAAGESPSGKLATKAAGAAVWLGRDFKADHVRRISTPPAELNGRGLDLE